MYQVKLEKRMSGQWVTVWTREPLDTLEKAEAKFEEYNHYSSDYSDVQLVDEAGNVIKDWINGKYQELFGGQ